MTFYGLPKLFLGWSYPPVSSEFKETDLIGTWQATYGSQNTTDTLKLRSDGTYQQVFQLPAGDYYYEGSWNNWHLEYTSDGRPKLHLEGMRYCEGTIYLCETTGRGESIAYFDFIDNGRAELTNEVILRVIGDENSSRKIRLWHLQIDEDDGPEYFVFIKEQ